MILKVKLQNFFLTLECVWFNNVQSFGSKVWISPMIWHYLRFGFRRLLLGIELSQWHENQIICHGYVEGRTSMSQWLFWHYFGAVSTAVMYDHKKNAIRVKVPGTTEEFFLHPATVRRNDRSAKSVVCSSISYLLMNDLIPISVPRSLKSIMTGNLGTCDHKWSLDQAWDTVQIINKVFFDTNLSLVDSFF